MTNLVLLTYILAVKLATTERTTTIWTTTPVTTTTTTSPSTILKWKYLKGYDCPGNDLGSKCSIASIDLCTSHCKVVPDCNSVSWAPNNNNCCYTKSNSCKNAKLEPGSPGIVSAHLYQGLKTYTYFKFFYSEIKLGCPNTYIVSGWKYINGVYTLETMQKNAKPVWYCKANKNYLYMSGLKKWHFSMWMKVNGKHAIAAADPSFCPPAKKSWMYRGGQKWQKGNITLKGNLCSKN